MKRSSVKRTGARRGGARLGQHFLTGLWAARALARAAHPLPGETILEIGPGKGALTRELLATDCEVVAVEKDEALAEELKTTFAKEIASGQLRLVVGDVRDFAPEAQGMERYVLAANIPYYITGEILRQFLTARAQPRALALLVQKEVAERVIARDGKESILSLSVKAYGTPSIAAKVSRGNFSPPPAVDSAILVIDGVSRTFFGHLDEDVFFEVVRVGFSSKRKKLINNLAAKFGRERANEALAAAGVAPSVRAEDAALNAWRQLARALSTRS